jgi:hypothetical protein
MRKQKHRPLFNQRVKYEVKNSRDQYEQREYTRQGYVNQKFESLKKWFNNLFGSRKPIEAAPIDSTRGHGANVLRTWWPALGKMVSTRDGRPV